MLLIIITYKIGFVNNHKRKERFMNVLFICTGNTCRSPMAAGFYNKIYGSGAKSARIYADSGACASENSVEAMKRRGIDISSHRAAQVTPDDIKAADRIYTMTEGHAVILKEAFPEAADKISVLGKGISDPFGADLETYERCADEICGYIENLLPSNNE